MCCPSSSLASGLVDFQQSAALRAEGLGTRKNADQQNLWCPADGHGIWFMIGTNNLQQKQGWTDATRTPTFLEGVVTANREPDPCPSAGHQGSADRHFFRVPRPSARSAADCWKSTQALAKLDDGQTHLLSRFRFAVHREGWLHFPPT